MRPGLFFVLPLAVSLVIGCSDDEQADDGSGGSGGDGTTSTSTSKAGSTSTKASSGSGSTSSGSNMCDSGPLSEPIQGCAPAVLPSSGDPHQDCVDRINQFRWECQCLPPLARWTEAESCSDDQSADDQASGVAHGNFPACGENAQNTCPDWGSEGDIIDGCLQMMWDEGPGPFAQHGHYLNMSSTQFGKVACGFASGGGAVWSNQNFAP